VLLTDGVATTGPPPLEAAQQAVDRGVRVYTIGFGTDQGGSMPGGDPFGGGGQFRRGIDEQTLKQVSDMTGGTYYAASSIDELQEVFAELPTSILKTEIMEISVVFATIGALLAALALGLGMRWSPLP
jgi:Ca-activated chloride channel family protein